LQNKKKRVEPWCLVLCRTMHGLKTCARRQEKQSPDRASEATSLLPIWDLETWFVGPYPHRGQGLSIALVVTRVCKARHDTEAVMTPDDNPWNPKAQWHSVISECPRQNYYVSYFLEWPVPPHKKKKYILIVPNRAWTHACFPITVWEREKRRKWDIGSHFWKLYLIRTSFTLGELVSLAKVFRLFRLERIVFVFRVWTQ